MADPAVIVEKDGPILIVTLNRPEKKNAVNSEVMWRLYDAWVQLDEDDELRVAILTGRIFGTLWLLPACLDVLRARPVLATADTAPVTAD